eukprot:scaffold1837_cov391-Prasinococcus_capsulatus_cf.AAC.1
MYPREPGPRGSWRMPHAPASTRWSSPRAPSRQPAAALPRGRVRGAWRRGGRLRRRRTSCSRRHHPPHHHDATHPRPATTGPTTTTHPSVRPSIYLSAGARARPGIASSGEGKQLTHCASAPHPPPLEQQAEAVAGRGKGKGAQRMPKAGPNWALRGGGPKRGLSAHIPQIWATFRTQKAKNGESSRLLSARPVRLAFGAPSGPARAKGTPILHGLGRGPPRFVRRGSIPLSHSRTIVSGGPSPATVWPWRAHGF